MRKSIRYLLLCLFILLGGSVVLAAESNAVSTPNVPYLLPDAPSFDLTLSQFREKYNLNNPQLLLGKFSVVTEKENVPLLNYAASKLSEYLYLSSALEKGSGKIKTLQITYLPIEGSDAKKRWETTTHYMAALMRTFDPTLSDEQSMANLNKLLQQGKGARFYQQQSGALRYVIVDNGAKGLTFAIEPIRLTLPPS